jgi:hypothetical protein
MEQLIDGQIHHVFVAGSEVVCDDPEENNEDCAACGWESECHTSEEPGPWDEGGCHEDCFETLARAADMVERWVHSNDGSLPQAPLVLAMNGRLQYDPTDGVLRLRDCTSTSIVASWVVPPQKRRLVRVAAAT